MIKALVTGATGFVGSWVARTLVEEGHAVRILRRSTSKTLAIEDLPVEHVIGDFEDMAALENACDGVNWVFHVAAISAYWRNDRDAIYRVNVDATRNLLKAAETCGVERFIFTSSAAAVGWREDGYPADETTYFNIDPRLSPYAHSKFLAEVEVHQAIQRGLDAVILNPSVVIGPGDLNQISGSLVLQIAQEKVPFMPMQGGITVIDVRDVAMSHLQAALKGQTGERYILGAVNLQHRALMSLIAQIVGKSAPAIPAPAPLIDMAARAVDIGRWLHLKIPGDAEGNQLRLSKREIFFDCSKAWRELHEPQIDVYESILDTYQWYQAQGII
jgi:dihydroflavonol-4-reductase